MLSSDIEMQDIDEATANIARETLVDDLCGELANIQAESYFRALLALSQQATCCGLAGELTPPGYFSGKSGPGMFRSAVPAPSRFKKRLGSGVDDRSFLLPAVTVVNPGETSFRADILVKEGLIVDIRTVGEFRPEGFPVMNACAGKYLMPGLIDMHAHLPSDNVLQLTPHFMRMSLSHGVTGLREAGDVDGTAVPAVRALHEKGMAVPRIAASCYFVGRPPFRWKNHLHYERPEDAPRIMEKLLAEGASCIKLYENLLAHDLQVLKTHATAAGLVVMGHVPSDLTLEQAALPDAQHFFGVPPPTSLRRDHVFSRTADWQAVDARRMEAVVDACARLNLANTPTLNTSAGLMGYRDYAGAAGKLGEWMPSFFGSVVWHPKIGLPAYRNLQRSDMDALEQALEKKKVLLRELHARGCSLFAGTDTMQAFSVPGIGLHQELALFVQSGMSVADALRVATIKAAERLGWRDVGKVACGYRADLMVLNEDPSHRLEALKTVSHVMTDGVTHEVSALRREIKADLDRRNQLFNRLYSHVLARFSMHKAARHFTA